MLKTSNGLEHCNRHLNWVMRHCTLINFLKTLCDEIEWLAKLLVEITENIEA